jgi:acetate---CoA ligase (ADP-forming)
MTRPADDSQAGDVGRGADVSEAKVSVLLRPRSIAVLGASDRAGVGQRVGANLRALNYAGELFLINPNRPHVAGVRAHSSIESLPVVPDLVVAAVNREATVRGIVTAAELGCRAAIVLAAGFAESDERGRELDGELRRAAGDMSLMGPNCLGYVNLVDGVAAYSGPLMEPPEPGKVALVSQSGALACAFTGVAAERGIRFSHVITTGNQIGLGLADYVYYLSRQHGVRVIACYVEGFTDGRELLAAMQDAIEAGKSVVVMKAGRSRIGGSAARTHTGALAGSASIQLSIWRQHGVLVATDPEEFLALVELCSRTGRLPGRRAGILTISGGERLLVADAAEELCVPLADFTAASSGQLAAVLPAYASAANPLDTTGAGVVDGDVAVHRQAADIVSRDPNVDIIIACQDAKNGWTQAERSSGLFHRCVVAAAEAASAVAKPLVVISPTSGDIDADTRAYLMRQEIPFLMGLRSGMSAVAQLIRSQFPVPKVAWQYEAPAPVPLGARKGWPLSGLASLSRLEEYGVPVCATRLAASEDEACRIAAELGYPVAMKIDGAGIQHRTELGGIRVGLDSEPRVRHAWRELGAVCAGLPGAEVLVQPMVHGVELFVGGVRDEQFGPVILCGPGGVLLEFIDDAAAALAPLDEAGALRLIMATRAHRLLQGFRGGPAADVGRLAAAVAAISRIAARPDVLALDVNPLIALPTGVAVVDAKIVMAGDGTAQDGDEHRG